MKISIIQVPYDSGHFGARMGRGPLALVGKPVEIAAVGLTAYDPSFDEDGRARCAAEVILDSVIETIAS